MHKEMMEQPEEEGQDKPWSAEKAQAWRAATHTMSPWLPALMQALVAVLLLLGSWVTDVSQPVRLSLACGVAASLLPSLLCVSGYRITLWVLKDLPRGAQTLMGLAAIFCWELVKLLLSVALLLVAARMVRNLSWLAMLLAFVVVVKAYWLAFLVDRMRKPRPAQVVLKTDI
ncbi:MAG: ATP synthase subunit I [Brachymonas sp.]|nr:ATP synthase subunit I [Brachymonas sp.]